MQQPHAHGRSETVIREHGKRGGRVAFGAVGKRFTPARFSPAFGGGVGRRFSFVLLNFLSPRRKLFVQMYLYGGRGEFGY